MYFDGSQCLAHLRHIIVLFQIGFRTFWCDFFQMCIGVFNTLVSNDQIRSSLLSDTRNTRNIVGTVTHQSLHIDKFLWCNLITFHYISCIIIFNLRTGSFCLRNPDFYFFRSKLQQITVTGNNTDIHALYFCHTCNRSKQIICLIPRHFHDFDAHGLQNFLHDRHLLPQFLSHRFSRSFIGVKHLMAERRLASVKSHCQIIRFLLIQNLEHNI